MLVDRMKFVPVIAMLFATIAIGAPINATRAVAPSTNASAEPEIRTDDVDAFYAIYDAANGHPSADALQLYIDRGSPGLRRLAEIRNVTGERIAEKIDAQPRIYEDAKTCMAVLPHVRRRTAIALRRLHHLYPEAKLLPVTIAVGRGKPVGVTDRTGVMIGLEALCGVTWMESDIEDRFVHVIAHEYAHVQQAFGTPALFDQAKPTVLETALIEGGAEFVGELISGGVSYANFATVTRGREKEIEDAFVRDEAKTDLSDWFYNGTLSKPGDLGYWVGYRITKSYYEHAKDKRAALRDILTIKDPKAFLAESGWYPGIRM
jgi:hypothetical protein